MKSSRTSTGTYTASGATSDTETRPLTSAGWTYAIERLALFVAKRYKRQRRYGYWRISQ